MSEQLEPCEIVPFCPICNAPMEQAHKLQTLHICVCLSCETTLTVTEEALKQFRARHPTEL